MRITSILPGGPAGYAVVKCDDNRSYHIPLSHPDYARAYDRLVTKASTLKALKIERVDVVNAGANPGARIAIAKGKSKSKGKKGGKGGGKPQIMGQHIDNTNASPSEAGSGQLAKAQQESYGTGGGNGYHGGGSGSASSWDAQHAPQTPRGPQASSRVVDNPGQAAEGQEPGVGPGSDDRTARKAQLVAMYARAGGNPLSDADIDRIMDGNTTTWTQSDSINDLPSVPSYRGPQVSKSIDTITTPELALLGGAFMTAVAKGGEDITPETAVKFVHAELRKNRSAGTDLDQLIAQWNGWRYHVPAGVENQVSKAIRRDRTNLPTGISKGAEGGYKLRVVRVAKKVTQDQLALRSGISQAHISKMENGTQAITMLTASRLAEGLGITKDMDATYLFCREITSCPSEA